MGIRIGVVARIVLSAAWLIPEVAAAQSGTSTIAGFVRDGSEGAVPGAAVTVVNEETGVVVETVTNETGLYRAGALVPGRYRVEIALAGFQRAVRSAITLEVNQTIAVDVVLEVARQVEAVTVVAVAPLIDSQSSSIAQTVTREMIAALPLPNRAASSLVTLAPGVIMIDSGAGTAENYPVFSVAGGRARNQNFILDGGNATNAAGLTRPQQLTTLPVDAMQEFRVISNNYAAEHGHSTGGVVPMSTRSGTNDFRGTAFESLQNDAFNARSFFASTTPPIRLNQFGGTFGGPIARGNTFFFTSWERTRQLTSEPVVSTVPTLANREGDFSDLRDSSGRPVVIYDPRTRQPFPGNVVPMNRVDPVAHKALQYFPLPNHPGTSTNANNHVANSSSSLDRDIVLGRVDHKLGLSDMLTVRYYINNSGTSVTGSYPDPAADPLAEVTSVRVQSLTGAHTHIFRSNLANELRITYLRRKFVSQHPGLGANLAGVIGVTGVSGQAFPAFNIPGYGSLAATAGNAAGQVTTSALGSANVARFQTPILDTQLIDALTWSRGRHAYKFGVES